MSGMGVKRDLVLNATICIYHKCENQPIIRWHISDPRQDLGPMGPLGENDQANWCTAGAKGL